MCATPVQVRAEEEEEEEEEEEKRWKRGRVVYSRALSSCTPAHVINRFISTAAAAAAAAAGAMKKEERTNNYSIL